MRALAGPAMLLVMAGAFLVHRSLSKEDAPARDFLELELAAADADHTGTCYSLSTVLIANRALSSAVRTWTTPRDDAWTLVLDDVTQGFGGPARIFQKFTFEKHGEQVHLVSMEGSEGLTTALEDNIDALLEAPHERHSTPVDRCLKSTATGYRFVPRR
jgi:hypothetical protein